VVDVGDDAEVADLEFVAHGALCAR
jgi:hypothetical protein